MRNYYIHIGSEQEGPFSLEILKEKKIPKNTAIWYEGLGEWTTADQLEELKDFFKEATPPPFKANVPPPPKVTIVAKKKTTSWRSIFFKTAVVFFIVVGILTVLNKVFTKGDTENFQASAMTIEEMEKSDPVKYLLVTDEVHLNFWGNKIKINGLVTNIATIANYKDVVLEVTFLSKTNSVIKTEQYTLYDFVNARSQKNFEITVTNWQATQMVSCVAIGATPY
jgi:hypothetical protein